MINKRILALTVCLAGAVAVVAPAQHDGDNPDAWEERHNAYQPPDQVLDAMGIKPGMIIAEVGAGRGRYVAHMSKRIGGSGKIYANDIDEDKLEYLRVRCERDGMDNVEVVLGDVTDPRLPEGEMDLVYMINTYHHVEKPVDLLEKIKPSLKPDGILVIIEHDVDKMGPGSHSTSQIDLFTQATDAGFRLVRIETFLERDNINFFRPAEYFK
jgi:ubiquinone/menaquinone biosynthesis C-methylase UbiE